MNKVLHLSLIHILLVFVPTIAEASPTVACALCSGIYVLVGTLMIVFILEICQEQGLTLCTVTTSNYGVFVLGAVSYTHLAGNQPDIRKQSGACCHQLYRVFYRRRHAPNR